MFGSLRLRGAIVAAMLAVSWILSGCRGPDQPSSQTTASLPAQPEDDRGGDAAAQLKVPQAELPPAAQPKPSWPAQPEVAQPQVSRAAEPAATPGAPEKAAPPVSLKLIPLELDLPAPAFRGTPPPPSDEPNVEKPLGKPRPPFLAPEGTANLARGKMVASSDPAPTGGELDLVTDGDKEASDFGYVQLRPGLEWVQVDLGQKGVIYAVLLWHNHVEARVYRDVIVQVSDDPDFLDATTVFNNDHDNSSGAGIGGEMGYVETSEGKLIDCRGVEGRYVRVYSRGNHLDGNNHYTEVEVFGRSKA